MDASGAIICPPWHRRRRHRQPGGLGLSIAEARPNCDAVARRRWGKVVKFASLSRSYRLRGTRQHFVQRVSQCPETLLAIADEVVQ